MCVRIGIAVVLTALAVNTNAEASAASRLVYIRKAGAERCPDERELRTAVAERLGYDPFFPWAEQTVVVRMSGQASKLRAEVELVDGSGVATGARELTGSVGHCDELLRSLALTLSITLDPMSVNRPVPPPTAPKLEEPAPSVAAKAAPLAIPGASPRDESTPKVVPPPPSAFDVAVYAGPLMLLGVGPGVAFGGRVGLSVASGMFSGSAEFRGDLPAVATSDRGGEAHVRFWGAAIAPCAHYGIFAGCGIVTFGSQRTWATGVDVPRDEALFYAAAGLRLQGQWLISTPLGLSLVASADGVKTLTMNRVRLHGEEIWSTASLASTLGLALHARFP